MCSSNDLKGFPNDNVDATTTAKNDEILVNDDGDDDVASSKSKPAQQQRAENAMGAASFLSRLFFYWPYPLLKLGLERPLDESDLPDILEKDTSKSGRNYFDEMWLKEKQRNPHKPNLHRAFLIDFFKSIWYIQPLLAAADTAKIIQAIALGLLIESFETGNGEGYKWAATLVGTGLVVLFEHHHVFFATWRKGMQMRISSIAAIYSKSLRLSSTHQETNASTGQIMNLASNDVERFLLAALFISHLIWSPIQAIAILVVGWLSIGPAFAAGFALLVFGFVPFQFYLSSRFAFFRSKIAAITDRRVTFVAQAVHGARVMKMSGYEWRFLDRIQAIRKEEVQQIMKATVLKAWNEALFYATNVVISLVIFLVHVYIGETLTPRMVFTVFTLINILQLEMTKHVALGVMGVSEVYVSISRIQNFLDFPEMPEIKHDSAAAIEGDGSDDKPALSMSNVTSYWNHVREVKSSSSKSLSKQSKEETQQPQPQQQLVEAVEEAPPLTDDETSSLQQRALSDITIDFKKGELTCIIGTVGSGKSALLQGIVGELPVSTGTIQRNVPTLAYASQDPWVMDGTVQENITMGLEFNQTWYDQVVDACGLRLDFTQFLNGDQTIVGDRGVQCSGGQRARIGLARAFYRDADLLVLDDPLSAVDAKVGRQLFNEGILGLAVNRGKCVVLATHQHQYVSDCKCVLMVTGQIEKIGTYDECVAAAGGKLTAHAADDAAVDALDDPASSSKTTEDSDSKNNADDAPQDESDGGGVTTKGETDDSREDKVSGVVSLDTYKNYARAMGGLWVAFLLLVLFSVTQGIALISIAQMGRWAERPPEEQTDWDIIGTVIGLGAAVIVLAVFRAMISFYLTVAASRTLHDEMTKAVLRAKIAFFDTNPLGRILNRFSADVGSNDDLLPQTLFDFLVILFIVLGTICTTLVVLPFALLVMPPLIYYFLSVRKIFVTSTRELKRLEGLARSPIFAMLSESLSGIATIRANDSVDFFSTKFEDTHDAHTRAFFAFMGSSRWVGFRMDSLMFMLMSLVSFLAVIFQTQGWFNIDPAILGLSISMLLQLAGLFQWCIRQSAEVVNLMVSVERVLGFRQVESEAPLELDSDKQIDTAWPAHGAVDVKDLAVRYRPGLPRALDGATFSIPSGSRVGVVGRTGSGKSTVVQTLFRLLEAEDGSISIDGIDISKVGLHRLRTRISVIPQSPTLFSGCTVRENLDLFGIHSDSAIQKALEDSHMGEAMANLPKGFDSMVSEGGSNFSVGQRQLLCLARAILSKNKLLVLDEATASVDRRTDQMLHDSLHDSFHGATILAVAHRLDTVIDHDYILVLGRGKVLEFGAPADLIRSGGAFSKMIDDTGDTMSSNLKQRAFGKAIVRQDSIPGEA